MSSWQRLSFCCASAMLPVHNPPVPLEHLQEDNAAPSAELMSLGLPAPGTDLQQRRLAEGTGERVQLRHELPELAHRQLVRGLSSPRAESLETQTGEPREIPGSETGQRSPSSPPRGQRPRHTPGLPFPVEQLLGDRGALLRILRDQAKVAQEIVVREFLHLGLFDQSLQAGKA